MNYRLTIIIALTCISCALVAQTDSTGRVWPSPPDRARIKYLSTISSFQSFESKKGLFSGIFSFLFGEEKSSRWFVQPIGIAISSSGKIYVTDPGAHGVHIIDQKEKDYNFLGESDFGKFRSPVGCAISNDGTIYISDSEQGNIVALDKDNDALFAITTHLTRPTGVQIHDGKLYVADAGKHAIVIFDLKGNYVKEFGHRGDGNGEFNFPVQLAVKESIDVVDALNHRVQKFGLDGTFGSSFGKLGNIEGRFASPKAIALDSDGNLYVSDALMDCIQIFNPAGNLLLVLGKNGSREGEFMTPNGVAIDKDDKIYVVESLNRRIQIFQYLK